MRNVALHEGISAGGRGGDAGWTRGLADVCAQASGAKNQGESNQPVCSVPAVSGWQALTASQGLGKEMLGGSEHTQQLASEPPRPAQQLGDAHTQLEPPVQSQSTANMLHGLTVLKSFAKRQLCVLMYLSSRC